MWSGVVIQTRAVGLCADVAEAGAPTAAVPRAVSAAAPTIVAARESEREVTESPQ